MKRWFLETPSPHQSFVVVAILKKPLYSSMLNWFRTLPETVIDALPSELIVLYRKAKIYQLNLEELYEGLKPLKENLIDRFPSNSLDDIPYLAASIRDILKISLEEQFSWRSVDKAFKTWRNVMEENGIFIFKDAFHNDDYSGFCVYDENYPIIFINNSSF